MNQLIERPNYIDYLEELENQRSVKILTGIRRSGKSSLLQLLIKYFKNKGIDEEQIIHLNLSSLKYEDLTYKEMYETIIEKYKGKKLYIFIDEVQIMKDWHKAVTSLFEDINCSIYLTGSNSELFIDQYAELLSGRYVIVEIFPLSFKEFLDFKGLVLNKNKEEYSGYNYSVLNKDGALQNLTVLFNEYLRYGGMPEIVLSNSEFAKQKFLDSIYLSVFVRDIEKYLGSESTVLLERLIKFLASSVGNRISINKLKNFLVSNGWINSGTHSERIQRLLNAAIHAYLFYPVSRFDVSGKKELTSLGKYYIADTGIRNNLIEFRSEDRGSILENIVFLELKRRNFKVHVGKVDEKEVDFVIMKNSKTSYLQVSETIVNPKVQERELSPLRKLNNAYKRIVLTTDIDPVVKHVDGIDIINIVDFLLDKTIME